MEVPSAGGYLYLRSSPFTAAGARDLGTITLPTLVTDTVRVVDQHGTPVFGAGFQSGATFLTSTNWTDYGFSFAPDLPLDPGPERTYFYRPYAVTNETGEITTSYPVMLDGSLPSVRVSLSLNDGTTHAANLADGTGDSPVTVTMNTLSVQPPNPVETVSTSPGSESVYLSWLSPATNGSPILGYTVSANPGGKQVQVPQPSDRDDYPRINFEGLRNGTAYTFTVTAHSAAGDSTYAHPSSITPRGVPYPVPAVTAREGDRQVTVEWTPAEDGGEPLTGYYVELMPGGMFTSVGPSTTSTTIAGLSAGVSYTARVYASNPLGMSQFTSSAAVTPFTTVASPVPTPPALPPNPTTPVPVPSTPAASAPSRMAAPRVVVRGTRIVVKWSAAVPNGSPITRYLIDIDKGKDKSAGAAARTTVFKKLKPGRYRFRIAAHNALGDSPPSAWTRIRVR